MPNLYMPSHSHGKVTSRGRESECGDRRLEGEVVEGDPSRDVRQYCLAIFVDGEEQITPRCETKSGNVFSMRKRESMGFVTAIKLVKDQLNYLTGDSLHQVKNRHSIPNRRE